jgi:hypothetical protein
MEDDGKAVPRDLHPLGGRVTGCGAR